jgi:hypothetical protein
MTELAEKPKRRHPHRKDYSEAEIVRALTEVAACSGNTHKAARNLAEDDKAPSISQQVLWEWSRRSRVDAYERIRQDQLPAIQAHAADQHMALARQQMELAQSAATFVASRLPQMDDKDLVNAMGKADIGSGIHTEKAQLLAGLPTHRVARSSEEILRELRSLGQAVVDAEVVSEETVPQSVPGSAVVPAPVRDPEPVRLALMQSCALHLFRIGTGFTALLRHAERP